MINFDHKAFIEELEKIAAELNPGEQRQQALQFAGLGAITAPLVSGAKNLAAYGRISPWGKLPRWLAATAAAGAVTGGVLPSIRHHLERQTQGKARQREQVDQLSSRFGMSRPMTQVKSAGTNLTGRDNRTPFVGGTQFPTEGSKSKAQHFHDQSVGKAEVGPAPLMGELDKTDMVPLGSVSPSMPSAKGSLPKIGGVMNDRIKNDPLVQYLKKHAKALETNVEDLATHVIEQSLMDQDSDFVGTPAEKKKKEDEELLKSLFSHYPTEKLQK